MSQTSTVVAYATLTWRGQGWARVLAPEGAPVPCDWSAMIVSAPPEWGSDVYSVAVQADDQRELDRRLRAALAGLDLLTEDTTITYEYCAQAQQHNAKIEESLDTLLALADSQTEPEARESVLLVSEALLCMDAYRLGLEYWASGQLVKAQIFLEMALRYGLPAAAEALDGLMNARPHPHADDD